jgi:hypothetical protein
MALRAHGGNSPLVECINPYADKWIVRWGEYTEEGNEGMSDTIYYYEVLDHKPTLPEIKEIVNSWYNEQIDQKLISGFTWKNMEVWLSTENQLNYIQAYDTAVQSNGDKLPTFKFGTTDNPIYYTFETLEELKDFYGQVKEYISTTISNGWNTKSSINWNDYEKLLE